MLWENKPVSWGWYNVYTVSGEVEAANCIQVEANGELASRRLANRQRLPPSALSACGILSPMNEHNERRNPLPSCDEVNLVGGENAERVAGARVSEGFFQLLGVAPQLGRAFLPDDHAAAGDPVAVLSDGLWRGGFGADPTIIGRTLSIDGVPHTVVGVGPRDSFFPGSPRLWTPFRWNAEDNQNRGMRYLSVIGRLAQYSELNAAVAELQTIFDGISAEFPGFSAHWSVAGAPLNEWIIGGRERQLHLLAGAAVLILLIASVNVTNLVLAHTEQRAGELAVRRALGASGARLARQVVTETLIPAALGGALGMYIAQFGTDLLVSVFGASLPRSDLIDVNATAFAFTAVLAVGTGVVVGGAPALRLWSQRQQAAPVGGVRGVTGGYGSLRGTLVVLEVAAAFVLITAAGMMLKSLLHLHRRDVGIETRGVLSANFELPRNPYQDRAAIGDFYASLISQLRSLGSVAAVGGISKLPLTPGDFKVDVARFGEPETAERFVEFRVTTSEYFTAVGTPLTRGRSFTDNEVRDGARVAILNEELTRRLFAGRDAIGELISPGGLNSGVEVVGVAADVNEYGPEGGTPPTVYMPGFSRTMAIVMRTLREPASLTPTVHQLVRRLDPDLPVFGVAPMNDVASQAIIAGRNRGLVGALLGVFAALSLVLSTLGVYGVASYDVQRGYREMGIRMALGAGKARVVGSVVSRSIRLAALGLMLGAGGAFLVGRAMQHLLFEVNPLDAGIIALVAVVLLSTTLAGCYAPARRASGADPAVVLRQE